MNKKNQADGSGSAAEDRNSKIKFPNYLNAIDNSILRKNIDAAALKRALDFDKRKTNKYVKVLREGKTPDWIPVRIYSESNDILDFERIIEALNVLLRLKDSEIVVELPPERGSWFQKFWATIKSSNTVSLSGRLAKIERAIELNFICSKKSHIDKEEAEAVSSLLCSLDSTDNAAIQVGSLLLIKVTKNCISEIIVGSLTDKQLELVENNPSILHRPHELLDLISNTNSANEGGQLMVSG